MSEERASRLLPASRSPAPLGRGKPRRERSFPRALTPPGAPGGWGASVGKRRPRGKRGAWDAEPGEHLQGAGRAAAGPRRSGDAALIPKGAPRSAPGCGVPTVRPGGSSQPRCAGVLLGGRQLVRLGSRGFEL